MASDRRRSDAELTGTISRYHRSLRGNQKCASLNDHFQAANRDGRNNPRRVFQTSSGRSNTPFSVLTLPFLSFRPSSLGTTLRRPRKSGLDSPSSTEWTTFARQIHPQKPCCPSSYEVPVFIIARKRGPVKPHQSKVRGSLEYSVCWVSAENYSRFQVQRCVPFDDFVPTKTLTSGTILRLPQKFIGSLHLSGSNRSIARKLLDLPGSLHFPKIRVFCAIGGGDLAKELVLVCSDTLESLCIEVYRSASSTSSAADQYLIASRRCALSYGAAIT